MELEELISESSPSVGPAPTLVDLRAGARRRRARRVRAIGAAVAVAVIAVLVPLLIPGDETNSTVAVRPLPVGRTLSSWTRVAEIPPDDDVGTTTQVELVASEGNVFVITHEERPDDASANWVRVAQIDPSTGRMSDLGYDSLRPAGSVLESAVGWRGGPAIVVETPDGWVVDHWVGGSWDTLERPDLPENAGPDAAVTTYGADLVLTVPLVGTIDVRFEGVVDQVAWSTGDGRAWTPLPAAPDDIGFGVYQRDGDSLLRQGFSPLQDGGSKTSILMPGDSEWTVVPPPPLPTYGRLRSATYGGVLVSCGTDEMRFDCSRWSVGDDVQRPSDPPPFPQGGRQDGRGEGLQVVAVPDRGVLVLASGALALYRPDQDRWRRVPSPSGAAGTTGLVVDDGNVYAIAYERSTDVDTMSTAVVYRLEVGEDDPEVDRAVEVGDGYRVRLPSDRWTAVPTSEQSGISVGTDRIVAAAGGRDCPGLRVEFVEGSAPDAGSPSGALTIPDSTQPCTPMMFTTFSGGRQFTVKVHRSVPTTPDDATELMDVIGSFRAAAR